MDPTGDDARAKDLREHWEYLRLRVQTSATLCVLSDFDGTLVPLEAHPDLPRLTGEARRVLQDLAKVPRVTFGVVSGRTLADLVPRVNLPCLWYVGIHGYEIRNPAGVERRFYEPEDVAYAGAVKNELAEALGKIPGVLLEHKGPVLAVHFRGVAEAQVGEVERRFLAVMHRHRTRLMMSRGHAVVEARPRGGANKGRAVSHIRHELPAGTLILYFGDDLTDRDAFRELRGVGLSVEVGGPSSSIADFTLPAPENVVETLSRILTVMRAPGQSDPGFRGPRSRGKE